jgi:16S rRNA (uracil1498-N3)-methyltransferase
VLEKGTEVGASFFVVVPTAESSRLPEASRAHRLARWGRIALEAAKQSKQLVVPPVELADSVEQAIHHLSAQGAFSLVLDPSARETLREKLERRAVSGAGLSGASVEAPEPRIALWVGPESGWSAAELERFGEAGIEAARLGQGVLRTETAGPVAVAVSRLAMGDW